MKGWVERLNAEMHYNAATALEVGLEVPDVKFLRGMTNAEIDDITRNPQYEMIGDTGMVMERIHGPDVTFHAFYKNGELSCRTASIVDGSLLSGGQGPNIGDNACTIFCGSNPIVDGAIDKLAELAIRHESEYTGFINVSVIFKDGIPYYRNIMYGTTYKFISGILELYDANMDVFFDDSSRDLRMSSIPGYGITLRVWSWPYDIEGNKAFPEGLMQWDGESYYMAGRGYKIKDVWRDLYSVIAGLGVNGACYKIDADVKARRIFNEIMRCQYVKRMESVENRSNHNRVDSVVSGDVGNRILPDATDNKDQESIGDKNTDSVPGLPEPDAS